jgi:hypothetical protein
MSIPGRVIVLLLVVAALGASPTPASAASCGSGTTSWTSADGGDWQSAANWDNGVPSAECDARIDLPGDYGVVLAGASGAARSLTIGGASGGQNLIVDAASVLHVGESGVVLAEHGKLELRDGSVRSAGPVRLAGGALEGSGSLGAVPGVENASGRVTPALGGVLRIEGTYTQGEHGTFAVEVPPAGSAADAGRLSASGTDLAGALVLSGAGPPKPGAQQIVALDQGAERNGFFDTVRFGPQPYDAWYGDSRGVSVVRACASGSTSWTNPRGGEWQDAENWSNGRPLKGCAARITLPGNYVVEIGILGGGGAARRLTLGATRGTQTLVDNDYSSFRNTYPTGLQIGRGGITVRRHGLISLYAGICLGTDGPVRLAGGRLKGSGRLIADEGVFNTSGTILLPSDFASTELTIYGDYNQGPEGTLAVNVGRLTEGYGWFNGGSLSVSGNTRLDGTLRLTGALGPLKRHDFLSSAKGRGVFAKVTLPGPRYALHYANSPGSAYVTRR